MADASERFYRPDFSSLNSEALNGTHDDMLLAAGRLSAGETVDLPDAVLALLDRHTAAINSEPIGLARVALAGRLATEDGSPFPNHVFDAAGAQVIAADLHALMHLSNETAVSFDLADQMEALRWNL